MELDIIKNQTTWNDASASINNNFAKVKTALEQGGGGGASNVYPVYVFDGITDEQKAANIKAVEAVNAYEDNAVFVINTSEEGGFIASGAGILDNGAQFLFDVAVRDDDDSVIMNVSSYSVNYDGTVDKTTSSSSNRIISSLEFWDDSFDDYQKHNIKVLSKLKNGNTLLYLNYGGLPLQLLNGGLESNGAYTGMFRMDVPFGNLFMDGAGLVSVATDGTIQVQQSGRDLPSFQYDARFIGIVGVNNKSEILEAIERYSFLSALSQNVTVAIKNSQKWYYCIQSNLTGTTFELTTCEDGKFHKYTFNRTDGSLTSKEEIQIGSGADLTEVNEKIAALTEETERLEADKQDALVSGSNIKTINGQSILGAGDIAIEGGGEGIIVDTEMSDTSENAVQNKVIKKYVDDEVEDAKVYAEEMANNAETAAKKYADDNKVAKVAGKQLSTEDFTTTLKQKLDGLANYDDADVRSAIAELQNELDAIVNGDATSAIDSIQEILAFLSTITDTQTLAGIVADLKQYVDDEVASAGGSIAVDAQMSDTSENAVQNKVIKAYVDDEAERVVAYAEGVANDAEAAAKKYTDEKIQNSGGGGGGGSIDPQILEAYTPLVRDFSNDFNNDFTN